MKGKETRRKRKRKKRDDGDDEAADDKAVDGNQGGATASMFDGLVFAVSGTFPSHSQAEVRRLVEERGGRVSASVTNAVTHVLATALGNAKTDAAAKKGLPVVKPAWLDECITQGRIADDAALQWSTATADEEEVEEEEKEKEVEEEGDDKQAKKAKTSAAGQPSSSPIPASAAASTTPSSPPAAPSPSSPASPPPQIKKVVVKGSVPVDDACPLAGSCHVYEDGNCAWDAMLNQTNISRHSHAPPPSLPNTAE